MGDSYQQAVDTFKSGFYCAESVLAVIAEEQGISSAYFPRIATGFCSGMARTSNMCGAVAGAIMALGLVYGRCSPDESVEKTYQAVQEFISRFEAEFGTSNCKALLTVDLGTEEGQQAFADKNMIVQCLEYTGKAAQITRDIIDSSPG